MLTNEPNSLSRKPRFRVQYNGTVIPAISVELESVGSYQADTFRIEVALNKDPAFGPVFWGSQEVVPLTIQFGFAHETETNVTWKTLFVGEVDRVGGALENGVFQVSGRDLTRRLIDAKTQEPFLNQTSSQIATLLAGRHGLTPIVTATTTPVQRFYKADHDHITLGSFHKTTTEWDLLTFLAQRENFDVFVQGTNLVFQPRLAVDQAPFFEVRYTPGSPASSNIMTSLNVERSITLAADIIVKVHTWHSGRAEGYTKIARLQSGSTGSKSKGAPQTVVYVFPNLTPAEAQARANAILADLSKHERVIEFDMPGDLKLTPRSLVKLTGTGTSWDQTYFVDTVRRTISFDQGFAMHVRAKNHSPQSQVQVS